MWGHTSQAKPSLNLGGVGGQGVVTLYDCRLRTGDIGGDSGSGFVSRRVQRGKDRVIEASAQSTHTWHFVSRSKATG